MEPKSQIQGISEKEAAEDELVDQIGQKEARRLIAEAVDQFAATSRDEIWRRRRDKVLHLLNVVEHNLDYDLKRIEPIRTNAA